MRSKPSKNLSAEGQGEPETNSAFDFIYHDGRRIASFLAQFDPSGHLTQLTQGSSANRSSSETSDIDTKANLLVGGIGSSNSLTTGKSVEHDISRVYDPMWSNAREFLDVLTERGLIQRNLGSAGIGQFVLLKGSLSVYDLDLIGKMWELKSIKSAMTAGLPSVPSLPKGQKPTAAARAAQQALQQMRKQAINGLDLFFDLAPHLPHAVQAVVSDSSGERIWCTLERQGLSISTADIVLKHGLSVPGEWAILGILDALPNGGSSVAKASESGSPDTIAGIFTIMAPIIRNLFGRPEGAFGVTPLLIFRDVQAVEAASA